MVRLRHGRLRARACRSKRARGLAGGECRDTKFCIVIGVRVLYRDRSEGQAAGGCVTIQSLYRDRWAVWLARRVTIQTIVS